MYPYDEGLGPGTLPEDDNLNPYCFCIALRGPWFLRKGAMIAHYGRMSFQALVRGPAELFSRFSSPLYARDWVVAEGAGHLMVADRGHDVNSYDLDDGNLTVRASNLLAFSSTLELKQSIVPGFLTLLGTGKFLASSNGPVIFMEPPLRVDPEALLGWADCPSPCHHYDDGWMRSFLGGAQAMLGRESGEERQFDFTGAGTVLLQSSEVVRGDPAMVRSLEAQGESLSPEQMQRLGQSWVQRAASRMQQG